MIFSSYSIKNILANNKTQTRRLVKEGESLVTMRKNKRVLQVTSAKGAIKWEVGKCYKVQAGRGIKSNGHKIKILNLKSEALFQINQKEANAEGFDDEQQFLYEFYKLNWNKVPKREKECCGNKPATCQWNPIIWRIKFRLVRQNTYDTLKKGESK